MCSIALCYSHYTAVTITFGCAQTAALLVLHKFFCHCYMFCTHSFIVKVALYFYFVNVVNCSDLTERNSARTNCCFPSPWVLVVRAYCHVSGRWRPCCLSCLARGCRVCCIPTLVLKHQYLILPLLAAIQLSL